MRVRVVVGEEITTRGGHLLGLFLERPVPALKSLRWSIDAVHEQGGIAIPAHPLVPYPLCAQGFVLRGLLDADDAAVRPDAIETFNPTALGRYWHERGRPVRRRPRPVRRSATAMPTRWPRSAPAGRASRAGPTTTCAPRSWPAPRPTTAASTARRASSGRSGGSCASTAATPGPRSAGGCGATGPGATTATRAATTGRRGSIRPTPIEDATMKIGLVSPYVYPLPGGVTQHVRYLYENLRLRGHDVRILTSSHGLQRTSEGDVIRLGKGFSMPANGSVGTITLSPRYVSQVRDAARARAVRRPPLPRAVRAVPVAHHPARVEEREHRDLPRVRRLLARLRVRVAGDARVRGAPPWPDRRLGRRPPLHRPLLPGRLQGHPQRRRRRPLPPRRPRRPLAGRHGRTSCSSAGSSPARASWTSSRPTGSCARPAASAGCCSSAAARRSARPAATSRPVACTASSSSAGSATTRRRSCSAPPTSTCRRPRAASRSGSCCSRRWRPAPRSSPRTSTATRAWSGATARRCSCRPRSPRPSPARSRGCSGSPRRRRRCRSPGSRAPRSSAGRA